MSDAEEEIEEEEEEEEFEEETYPPQLESVRVPEQQASVRLHGSPVSLPLPPPPPLPGGYAMAVLWIRNFLLDPDAGLVKLVKLVKYKPLSHFYFRRLSFTCLKDITVIKAITDIWGHR